MQIRGNNSLEFGLLADIPGLVHAVFLREGGVSTGPYHSFNVSENVGDDPAHVADNLARLRQRIGLPCFVKGDQVHGKDVFLVSSKSPDKIPKTDGLITQKKGIGLMATHADCQALLLFDPIHRAIGAVHAGWRGNVLKIFTHTIEKMSAAFGSKPENLLACISPSLGPEHAEFKNYREEFPESFWEFQVKPNYFDLWEISRQELLAAGILPHHIEIAKICTYSHPDKFYSYRREKVTGRHGTVIGLL